MPLEPFRLTRPAELTSAVVFSSPHSGRDYPWGFLKRSVLDERTIRSSEDAFVDRLISAAPEMGAPLICATAPRAFVDLNRNIDELDPALIEGVARGTHNPRITSGLGVIPRVVAGGRVIYRGKLHRREAEQRLDRYWTPYHTSLQSLLDEAQAKFGHAVLIDWHSMPHEAITGLAANGRHRPDVVLGDRFGAASHSEVMDQVEAAFAAAGLKVARNVPFAGAFITQHYGRPSRRQHAIQIEIDRSLYMNERTIRQNRNFEAFRRVVTGILAELADIGRPTARPMAAE